MAVIKRFKILAGKRHISLISKIAPGATLFADGVYIERMIANLVKNSIIYGTEGGTTQIQVSVEKGDIVIKVIDNGIGISKEDLPYVFDRFYRADKSHGSDNNSTGLGLAIVKWIAEAHDGEVRAQWNAGGGTIFTVTLPVKDK